MAGSGNAGLCAVVFGSTMTVPWFVTDATGVFFLRLGVWLEVPWAIVAMDEPNPQPRRAFTFIVVAWEPDGKSRDHLGSTQEIRQTIHGLAYR